MSSLTLYFKLGVNGRVKAKKTMEKNMLSTYLWRYWRLGSNLEDMCRYFDI